MEKHHLVDLSDETMWRQSPTHDNVWVSKEGKVYNSRTRRYVEPRSFESYPVIKLSKQDEEGRWIGCWKRLHILVAEIWVHNPKPNEYNIVNHINGNKQDARAENLEWCTTSMNNQHAIDTGLRGDAIACYIRDFDTKEVKRFPSLGAAKAYMGLRRDTPISMLNYKRFGKLIKDRWEFRYEGDPRPWFYETRTRKVSCRFIVEVTNPDGNVREYYNLNDFRQDFKKLYDFRRNEKGIALGGSLIDIVPYARKVYPDYKFVLHDSFDIDPFQIERKGNASDRGVPVMSIAKNNTVVVYSSARVAALAYNVPKERILRVLNNPKKRFMDLIWCEVRHEISREVLGSLGLISIDKSNI